MDGGLCGQFLSKMDQKRKEELLAHQLFQRNRNDAIVGAGAVGDAPAAAAKDTTTTMTRDVWDNMECVTMMQSLWSKQRSDNQSCSNKRLGSTGDTLSSLSPSDDSKSPSSPPGFLSIEQKKKGRLLLNQIFNELETLETDRIYYEGTVGIPPLIEFRQLLRSTDYDATGVQQMLSETQRQFDLHVCFWNAMNGEVKKTQQKPPPNERELFLLKMLEDAAKRTGEPLVEIPKSEEERNKEELDKKVQAYVGKITGEWEKLLHSIHRLGKGNNCSGQFQNLEFMPFYLDELVKTLKHVRTVIWVKFFQVQLLNGKSPNPQKIDLKTIVKGSNFKPKGTHSIPRRYRNRK